MKNGLKPPIRRYARQVWIVENINGKEHIFDTEKEAEEFYDNYQPPIQGEHHGS